MIALGNDDILVPIAWFERRLNFVGRAHRAGDLLLAILVQEDFFAASCQYAAHPLFVEDAGVSLASFHVRLVAADDPAFRIENFAAILDSRIGKSRGVLGYYFERAAQLKIADGSIRPNQKRVAFDRVLLAGFPVNRAVFDRP